MCQLLLALANWLGGVSRLVAYLIRVFRMPLARDERTGSRNRTEEPIGPRCNCHSERTKSFRPPKLHPMGIPHSSRTGSRYSSSRASVVVSVLRIMPLFIGISWGYLPSIWPCGSRTRTAWLNPSCASLTLLSHKICSRFTCPRVGA